MQCDMMEPVQTLACLLPVAPKQTNVCLCRLPTTSIYKLQDIVYFWHAAFTCVLIAARMPLAPQNSRTCVATAVL